jgi:hypothetical protein
MVDTAILSRTREFPFSRLNSSSPANPGSGIWEALQSIGRVAAGWMTATPAAFDVSTCFRMTYALARIPAGFGSPLAFFVKAPRTFGLARMR